MELGCSVKALRELLQAGRASHQKFIPFDGIAYGFPAVAEFLKQSPVVERTREVSCSAQTEERFLSTTTPTQLTWNRRELRELCWSRRAFADPRFAPLLESKSSELRSSAIKGLVFCLQHRWPPSRDTRLATCVRDLVQKRSDSSAVLSRWWEQRAYILDEDAAQNLGNRVAHEQRSPEEFIQELNLFPSTPLIGQAIEEACNRTCQMATSDTSRLPFLLSLLRSDFLTKERCCSFLSRIIVDPTISRDESARNMITTFMLTDARFGDPRLRQEQWFGISSDAQRTFISWLTHQDIELFFNLIVDDRHDVHGRKAFWLQYASKAIKSRSILCPEDLSRHRAKIAMLREDGKLVGEFRRGHTSAFIMDFGTVVAVEFSRINNALFLYPPEVFHELMPDFWRAVVSPDALKVRGRTFRDGWITHRDNWQILARRVLAKERVTLV